MLFEVLPADVAVHGLKGVSQKNCCAQLCRSCTECENECGVCIVLVCERVVVCSCTGGCCHFYDFV